MSSFDGGEYATKKPYAELIGIIQDPNHVEYLARLEWSGDVFDPEVLNLDLVKQRLARIR